jgi:NitT/TauT family transport system substrate-binding protein
MKLKKVVVIILIIAVMMTVGSCKKEEVKKEIIIAEQFGLAYAPIQIMKEKGFLDNRLEGYDIKWVKLGNTAAIREAILADSLDIGFLGIPPFLIGYDNKMDWKIFSGLSVSPLGLVTSDNDIKSLKDIKSTDKIVVPQPGSIQHILLSMGAEREFGDAGYFDNQLLTMKHPDGMSALLSSDEVSLHFTSPPYLFQELAEDTTSLLISGDECFGDEFTFIVGMTTEKFHNDIKAFNSLKLAISDAVNFINENEEESLEILNEYYDLDEEILRDYVYNQGIKYTTEVKGLDVFVEFMKKNGYINSDYDVEQLQW